LPNGWRIYTNQEAGYSVNVPSEATLRVESTSVGIDYPELIIEFRWPDIGFQAMQIFTYGNPNQITAKQHIINYFQTDGRPVPDDLDAHLETITINGLPATRTAVPASPFALSVLIVTQNKIYYTKPYGYMNDAPSQQMVDMFYQILETFSLTQAP
jgi:hypothetical protein